MTTIQIVTVIYAAMLLIIGWMWWGYARAKDSEIRAWRERCAAVEAACEPLYGQRNNAMTLVAAMVDTWLASTEAADALVAEPWCPKARRRRKVDEEAHGHACENAVYALYGARPVSGVRRKTNGEVRCG